MYFVLSLFVCGHTGLTYLPFVPILIMDKLNNMKARLERIRSENITNCEYVNEDTFIRIDQEDKILNILHINIRGLIKNKEGLSHLLDNLQSQNIIIDVILLCETFLTPVNECLTKISGYNCYHKMRKDRLGGGVSIYVHESLSVAKVIDTIFEDGKLETITMLIRKNKLSFIVSEMYRIPSGNLREFNALFGDYVNNLLQYKVNAHVIGTDQNIDLLKLDHRSETAKYFDKILQSGLEPTITLPTRITHTTATLIDNIFIKRKLDLSLTSKIIEEDISDHFPCLTTLKSKKFGEDDCDVWLSKRKFNDQVYQKIAL